MLLFIDEEAGTREGEVINQESNSGNLSPQCVPVTSEMLVSLGQDGAP